MIGQRALLSFEDVRRLEGHNFTHRFNCNAHFSLSQTICPGHTLESKSKISYQLLMLREISTFSGRIACQLPDQIEHSTAMQSHSVMMSVISRYLRALTSNLDSTIIPFNSWNCMFRSFV